MGFRIKSYNSIRILNPVNIIVIDLDQSKVEVIHEREGTFPT